MTTILVCNRFQKFTATGSMGVVTDTRYVNCFWPVLDQPTALFVAGSSSIEVMGSCPRNVIFPNDTVFLDFKPDALYPADLAVLSAISPRRMVNLSPEESDIWWGAYQAAVSTLPLTASTHATHGEVMCLRHREPIRSKVVPLPEGGTVTKTDYDQYVTEINMTEARDVAAGRINPVVLRSGREFLKVNPAEGEEAERFTVDATGKLSVVVAPVVR